MDQHKKTGALFFLGLLVLAWILIWNPSFLQRKIEAPSLVPDNRSVGRANKVDLITAKSNAAVTKLAPKIDPRAAEKPVPQPVELPPEEAQQQADPVQESLCSHFLEADFDVKSQIEERRWQFLLKIPAIRDVAYHMQGAGSDNGGDSTGDLQSRIVADLGQYRDFIENSFWAMQLLLNNQKLLAASSNQKLTLRALESCAYLETTLNRLENSDLNQNDKIGPYLQSMSEYFSELGKSIEWKKAIEDTRSVATDAEPDAESEFYLMNKKPNLEIKSNDSLLNIELNPQGQL